MDHPIERFLADRYDREAIRRVTQHLQDQGTFAFPTLASGLFSAAVLLVWRFHRKAAPGTK